MNNNYNNNPENENFLFGKDKKLPFIVPEGYFSSFESLLRNKMEVMKEIEEFHALSGVQKTNEFTVPASYFSKTKNQLELKCELADFSVLSAVPKRKMEDVKGLSADNIIASGELKMFATLSSIQKENKFEVSANYFETSADAIKESVNASVRPKGKVVQIFFRPRMIMAYAAAIVIAVAATFYFHGAKQEMVNGDCKTLACLEKNEILNEKTLNDFSEQDLYDMVDETQLDQQLSASDSLSANE